MSKSAEAFRTISEVAEVLDTPAHVLRFWESRFTQIKPVKRAGGRRYYRPADVALLGGIRKLLHVDGLTIRGVQKLLREQGVRHVAAFAGLEGEETVEEAIPPQVMAARPPSLAAPPPPVKAPDPLPIQADDLFAHAALVPTNAVPPLDTESQYAPPTPAEETPRAAALLRAMGAVHAYERQDALAALHHRLSALLARRRASEE
ncbi:MAG: MerR family transcriptional regulator [Rhodobacteraceae bacterium]|nr:MerR family transcriptional regulator [Paracoccaceae bacterium]